MNVLDCKIDNMTVKEMLKTFGIVMGGLMGFGIFFFLSSPFIWFLSNHSVLFELWRYVPIYFLIIFCGWIVYYAITPQQTFQKVEDK